MGDRGIGISVVLVLIAAMLANMLDGGIDGYYSLQTKNSFTAEKSSGFKVTSLQLQTKKSSASLTLPTKIEGCQWRSAGDMKSVGDILAQDFVFSKQYSCTTIQDKQCSVTYSYAKEGTHFFKCGDKNYR